ncbi:MAG: hypothetical protein VX768_21495 [Planctomycetota bacterium]|nr:hypothetical protein [Planctomycetota bacterium]
MSAAVTVSTHKGSKFFFVKTDEHFFANPKTGGSQISAGTNHDFDQILGRRRVLPDVIANDFFPPRSGDSGAGLRHFHCLIRTDFFLAGVGQFGGFNSKLCKNLLRFFAAGSAASMVIPVNFFGQLGAPVLFTVSRGNGIFPTATNLHVSPLGASPSTIMNKLWVILPPADWLLNVP